MQPPPAAATPDFQSPLDSCFSKTDQSKIRFWMTAIGVGLIALGILCLIGTLIWSGPLLTSSVVAVTVTDVITTTALTTLGKWMVGGAISILAGIGVTLLTPRAPAS